MSIDLRTLAREGARARIAEVLTELAELRRAFPEIGTRSTSTSASTHVRRRARRQMTAAERKAVGIRMKAYWAARRKAKAKAQAE